MLSVAEGKGRLIGSREMGKRWGPLLGVALLFAAGTVQGSQALPAYYRAFKSFEADQTQVRVELGNDLVVLIEEFPSQPLVAAVTSFEGGFQGPGSFERAVAAELLAIRLDEAIRLRGGFTSWEQDAETTWFTTVVPADEVNAATEAHLTLLRPLEGVDLRAGVEMALFRYRERMARFPWRWGADVVEFATGGAPAEPDSGTSEEAVRLAQARDFRASRAILSLAGSVRREVVLRKLADLSAELPETTDAAQGEVEEAAPEDTVEEGFRYLLRRGRAGAPMVTLGFRAPPAGHPAALSFELLTRLIAEGSGSLFTLPREDEETPPFVSRSSYLSWSEGERYWILLLKPEEDRLERAGVRAFGSIGAIQQAAVPRLLLNRAKARVLADYYRRLESLDGRALELSRFEREGGYKERDRFPSRIEAVEETELRQAARQFLAWERLTLIEDIPVHAEPREFTAATYREAMEILAPPEVQAEVGFLETFRDEVAAFKAWDFKPSFSTTELRRSSILRGPEIYVKESHTVPLANLGFFYVGGRAVETSENAGITRVLLRALAHHLNRLEGGRPLLETEAHGAVLHEVNEPDFFGYFASAPGPGFLTTFDLLVNWFRSEQKLEQIDLDLALKDLEMDAWSGVEDCSAMADARRRGRAELFAGHSYAFAATPCDRLPRFDLTSVQTWRDRHSERIHPYLAVSGDIAGTSFLEAQISRLSDARYEIARPGSQRVRYPEGVRQGIEETAGEIGVLLFEGPRIGSDFIEMIDVGAALLNGPAGRLSRILREKGLGSEGRLDNSNYLQGGVVELEVLARPGKAGEALAAALAEIRSLHETEVPENEFLSSLVAAITRHTQRRTTPRHDMVDLMTAVLGGEPADFAGRYVLNVKQMRMGEVESAFQRFLGGTQ